MFSALGKLRAIGLGNWHDLLDRVIDMNSIPVLQQHLRDLEAARRTLEGEVSSARFDLANIESKQKEDAVKIETMRNNAATLVNANGGNPTTQQTEQARGLAMLIGKLEKKVAERKSEETSARENLTSQTKAVSMILAKEDQFREQIGKLKAMQASSAAKARATKAVETVTSALDATNNIDGLAEKIGRENAVNHDAFERAMSKLEGPTSEADDAAADALLASLKK